MPKEYTSLLRVALAEGSPYALGTSRSGAIHRGVPPPVEDADRTVAARVEIDLADGVSPPDLIASEHCARRMARAKGS